MDAAIRPFNFENRAEPTYRLRLARYADAARWIDAIMGDRPGLALDAGSGNGRLARFSLAPGLRWIGLDISPDRLRVARATGAYRLMRGDVRAIPIQPAMLDVVACIQVLEHFDPEIAAQIAADLGQLLKPGGLLVLSVPIFPASWLFLKRCADRALGSFGAAPLAGEGHRSHFSLSTALHLIPDGFRIAGAQGQRLGSLPGKLLESQRWWYELHRWWGRRFPQWSVEANLYAMREDGSDPSRGDLAIP